MLTLYRLSITRSKRYVVFPMIHLNTMAHAGMRLIVILIFKHKVLRAMARRVARKQTGSRLEHRSYSHLRCLVLRGVALLDRTILL